MSFDINNYKWSDDDIALDCENESVLFITVNCLHECSNEILKACGYLKKKDAIAIAKHFGLTADDLKDEK